MRMEREEIRTGLLVVVTLVLFVALLLYLGAPGVFSRQKTFWVYFSDASGIKPGAQVLLAGRKIGQVRRLFSPVPERERPAPGLEVLIEVRVEAAASIYRRVKVTMEQPKLLGEPVIDFASGEEASGLAPHGHTFIGERQRGLSEAVPAVLEKLDPVLVKATQTMESLQKTAENVNRLTGEESDLTGAVREFHGVGRNLREMTGSDGALRSSLSNIEELTSPEGKIARTIDNLANLTGPESSLARAIENAERFTARLVNNRDLEVTLRNFRQSSEKLERTIDDVGGQFTTIGANLEQASDTLKHQPWRLIWPTTKKYPEDRAAPTRRKLPKNQDKSRTRSNRDR